MSRQHDLKNNAIIGEAMKPYTHHDVINTGMGKNETTTLCLVSEEPLSIRVQGKPYTVVMRTPGDEIAHVAGFCLGEGLVDSPDEFNVLAYCEDDVNVVTVTLSSECQNRVSDLLLRRGFISQTSCGICGKELIDDLKQLIPPVLDERKISLAMGRSCLFHLSDFQPLRDKTRSSHGAALFDSKGRILAIGEDVGRHNALDKVVGKLFLEKKLHDAAILVLSSRVSYELVQKAARAMIPVIFSVSRPTALGVDLADKLGMTLACQNGAEGLFVFCGAHRLSRD